ncbi:isochorismate synthase [Rossellomorea marisflavi]|uniref:isochorismate synthase n=1 Tax=Rossellomorea marisflavi TaxID=189381 RepID=UPI0039BFE768
MVTIQKTNIDQAYDAALLKAQQINHPVLFSMVEETGAMDPLSFYHAGGRVFKGERFLWKDRDQTISLIGAGSSYDMSSSLKEGERFFAIEKEWKRFISDAVVVSREEWPGTGPLAFGGFRFDSANPASAEWTGFDEGTLRIPRYMITKAGEANYLTVNIVCRPDGSGPSLQHCLKEKDLLLKMASEPASQMDPGDMSAEDIRAHEWKQSVRNVVDRLKNGEMEKVVLARKTKVSFSDEVTSDYVLDNLWKQQPDSFIFSFEQEGSCFIGATPERLVKKDGEEILSTCLAGSIARGSDLEEDERLGRELLEDDKNRYEHQLVVDTIRQALSSDCERLSIPDEPQLMKLKDIQHLYTPVKGTAPSGLSILTLVEKLHPTPALGGVPRKEAMQVIREEEQMDRGLYAGPIGWMDAYGNGEYAVALRSGLLKGDHAFIYAGCGIVAHSDPDSEFKETQMKFRPMQRALGGNLI